VKKLWPDHAPLDVATVNKMFDAVEKNVLCVPVRTPKGLKRRVDQTVWSTVVREGWSQSKRGRAEDDDDDDDETDGDHGPS